MKFRVFDRQTGEVADPIATSGNIATKNGMRCPDKAFFILDDDGDLAVVFDDGGLYFPFYVDSEKYEVRFEPDYRVCGNCFSFLGVDSCQKLLIPVKQNKKACQHWKFCGAK